MGELAYDETVRGLVYLLRGGLTADACCYVVDICHTGDVAAWEDPVLFKRVHAVAMTFGGAFVLLDR